MHARSAHVRRTRRAWKPNAQYVSLWSDILDERISVRATTSVLRWVDKVGGLDSYLLHTPTRKLQSALGLELKQRLLSAKRSAVSASTISSSEIATASARAALLIADNAAYPGSLWEDQLAEGELPPLNQHTPALKLVDSVQDEQRAAMAAAGTLPAAWKNIWEAGEDEPDVRTHTNHKRADGWHRWVVPSGRVMLVTPAQYQARLAAAKGLQRTRIPIVGRAAGQRPTAAAAAALTVNAPRPARA
jgi:large subunit ribosomal protein L28